MKKYFILILVWLLLGVVLYNCSDDTTSSGSLNNNDPGILRTDEFGNELGGDTTDWCYRGGGNGFKFSAAYPNPTAGNITHVQFSVPATDTIKLYILKSPTDTIVYYNRQTAPGVYSITINDSTEQFRNTYQRLYISTTLGSPGPGCNLYGDIRFEH
jgi:hypothetical protein